MLTWVLLLACAPRRPGRGGRRPAQARAQLLGHDLEPPTGEQCPAVLVRSVRADTPGVHCGHRTVPHGPIVDTGTVAAPQPGADAGLRRWCTSLLGRLPAARVVRCPPGCAAARGAASGRVSAPRPRCPLGQGARCPFGQVSGGCWPFCPPSAAGPMACRAGSAPPVRRRGPRCAARRCGRATGRARRRAGRCLGAASGAGRGRPDRRAGPAPWRGPGSSRGG
jgi:hypothetical protein